MNQNISKNYFFILFSIIPISFLIGPAISLINILLIDVSFIFYILYRRDYRFINNIAVKVLFVLYIYLIFNSFISQDFFLSIKRNFGFIRFIVLFIAFNFFFKEYENFNKIFYAWFVIIIFLCFDVYLESLSGTNILGFGEEYGRRIVSFFKDEPVVGAYLNGFLLIILGSIIHYNKDFTNKYKFIFLLISVILFGAIVSTGERSNTIKAFIGILTFFILINNFSLKQKFFSFVTILLLSIFFLSSSEFLKKRYGGQLIERFSTKEKFIIYYNKNIYFDIYRSGFNVFKNYPIFGVGNKNYRFESCDEEKNQKFDYHCTTHPHQTYFELLSEHGIIGSLIILGLIFYLLFRVLRIILLNKNYLQLGCFIYLLIVFIPILPSGSFFNDFNASLFWINFSIMYAANKETNIFN